jgi:hypothetical protein
MSFSFLQLAVGSRDLSQAEKEIFTKLSKFTKWQLFSLKMTNFFIEDHFEMSIWEFAQLCKQLFLSYIEVNHVIQQSTEES